MTAPPRPLVTRSALLRNRHDRHIRTRRAELIRVRRAQKQEKARV